MLKFFSFIMAILLIFGGVRLMYGNEEPLYFQTLLTITQITTFDDAHEVFDQIQNSITAIQDMVTELEFESLDDLINAENPIDGLLQFLEAFWHTIVWICTFMVYCVVMFTVMFMRTTVYATQVLLYLLSMLGYLLGFLTIPEAAPV